tara:strand:+ start:1020 stop:1226 length:207 start_codon:yes stop_codon:yes gene_type:complete
MDQRLKTLSINFENIKASIVLEILRDYGGNDFKIDLSEIEGKESPDLKVKFDSYSWLDILFLICEHGP